MTDSSGSISADKFNDQMFYQKLRRWEREHEYRMIRPLSDYPEYKPQGTSPHRDDNKYTFDFSLDCLESVTFGARMSMENKKKIEECCKGKKVEFHQAIIVRDQKDDAGNTGVVKLISMKKYPRLWDIGKSFLFFFNAAEMEAGPVHEVEISGLSDLPYWAGNREFVLDYYNKIRGQDNPTGSVSSQLSNQRRITASPRKTTQRG